MTDLLELKPNRLLLDSQFEGYKLSLREIPITKCTFKTKVDRILLGPNQYSILHAKLFGLHNHFIGDEYDENGSVYFVDEDWVINKVYIDPLSDVLIEPIKVWQIPKIRERLSGDYNVSMKFVSPELTVVTDGTGFLYILQTGCRDNDDNFKPCFSEEVAGPNEAFLLVDAVLKNNKPSSDIHVLLISIKQLGLNEQYQSVIHWITLTLENDKWVQTSLKQLKTKGAVQYAALEQDCEAVYIASDHKCDIVLNSDNPVLSNIEENHASETKYSYSWLQTEEDITILIELPENAIKNLISVQVESLKIDIKYDKNNLVSGPLSHKIDSDLTNWVIQNNKLTISLYKQELGLMWSELIIGDDTGLQILNSDIVDKINKRFAGITNEEEVTTQAGTTFNSQEVEECDFEYDKDTIFERLCGVTNKTTHKINLGSHQILMTAKLNVSLPPAIGIKYDVDICLWQPDASANNFSVKHEGTLLALGYVQASKQNRKFLVCPPNMEYSVICESSGHIFIYRQQRPIVSSDLRHRTTGKRILNIAEQQVLNVTNDDILGIYPLSNKLFLLCENYVMVLKL